MLYYGRPADYGASKRLVADGYQGQKVTITVEGIKGGRAVDVQALAYDGGHGVAQNATQAIRRPPPAKARTEWS